MVWLSCQLWGHVMSCDSMLGNVAALNMLGKEKSFDSIPFFWTVLFGKSLRYCGQ